MFNCRSHLRWALLTGVSFVCLSPVWAQEAPDDDDALRQQTVVVRGAFIPDEKRNTSEVSSLIDSEDFTVAGDSDAAAALARVAGVSTAESRFVYVRGLNERYSSATLNGSPLPSPEPLRRVAPLDLFPTAVLETILVQKTFSPDLPGEFGGGLVDIRTRAVPDEAFFEFGFGLGGNTETTFQDGLLYDGSDTDFLGFDDGDRDLPAGYDSPDGDFGWALTDNSSLLVMQEGPAGPDVSFDMTGGQRWDLNQDLSIGVLASASYSNEWTTREGTRGFANLEGDGLSPRFPEGLDLRSTENSIGINGYASVGFDIFSDHEIRFTGLITRSTDKEARSITGLDFDDNIERRDSLEFFERQLWTGQVAGEHVFPALLDLEVEWRASYSEAYRDAPYQFNVLYQDAQQGRGLQTVTSGADNTFAFSRIDDDATDFGIDATLPLGAYSADCTFFCETDIKVGYSYVESDRDAVSRLYSIEGLSAPSSQRIDYVYNDLFRYGGGSASSIGGNTFPEAYIATLEVDAAYLGLDTQITPYIRGAIGGRFERAIQAVDTMVLGADPDENYVESCIERQDDGSCDHTEDFLPAVTITWNPIEDLQVRAGYSETLTRPQFRELAPTEFLDTQTDQNFVGNPFLENASIKNYDARAEYYFGRSQFITVGLFYKDMERPIEEIDNRTADTPRTTFINVPSAELYGVEMEYEQVLPLDRWFSGGFLADKDFTVKANYTWSDSEVSAGMTPSEAGYSTGAEFCAALPDQCVATNQSPLNPTVTLIPAAGLIEDGRQLQGQSEHLANLQLIYGDPNKGAEVNLLLNYASERIRSGESLSLGIPAVLEQPPMTVDLVYNREFTLAGGEYKFSFNVENILGDEYEAYQERGGDRVDVDVYEIGTSVSLGLTRKF